jgi:hypothetical protein
MNAAARLFVSWVFTTCLGFIVNESPLVEAPDKGIPDDAEEISNEYLYEMYGLNGMSENIRLFIYNGDVYVYYESVNGVKIWQTVEIPHGWRVKEDFQLMCYSWYNPDDDEFPQNLQILVFFERGFLKLTFSSKSARHEVKDNNFVRLVDISVHPYSSISEILHGQQTTMHQYVLEKSMLFVTSSQCNNMLVVSFQEIYYDEIFDQHYCKVVLPLSKNVEVVTICEISMTDRCVFFNSQGRRIPPDVACHFTVMTLSKENFFVELRLIPPSDLENLEDDGTEGLKLYSKMNYQSVSISDCIKSSGSKLSGFIYPWDCQEEDPDPARLLEIFPVKKMRAKMCSDPAEILTSFWRMNLDRVHALQLQLEETQSVTDCRICMKHDPKIFIFSCGHAYSCQSCIDSMTYDGMTFCLACKIQTTSIMNRKDFLLLCRKFFPKE